LRDQSKVMCGKEPKGGVSRGILKHDQKRTQSNKSKKGAAISSWNEGAFNLEKGGDFKVKSNCPKESIEKKGRIRRSRENHQDPLGKDRAGAEGNDAEKKGRNATSEN